MRLVHTTIADQFGRTLGFKHYVFDAEAAQIPHDISKAASYFHLNQLPELYTAFRRDERGS